MANISACVLETAIDQDRLSALVDDSNVIRYIKFLTTQYGYSMFTVIVQSQKAEKQFQGIILFPIKQQSILSVVRGGWYKFNEMDVAIQVNMGDNGVIYLLKNINNVYTTWNPRQLQFFNDDDDDDEEDEEEEMKKEEGGENTTQIALCFISRQYGLFWIVDSDKLQLIETDLVENNISQDEAILINSASPINISCSELNLKALGTALTCWGSVQSYAWSCANNISSYMWNKNQTVHRSSGGSSFVFQRNGYMNAELSLKFAFNVSDMSRIIDKVSFLISAYVPIVLRIKSFRMSCSKYNTENDVLHVLTNDAIGAKFTIIIASVYMKELFIKCSEIANNNFPIVNHDRYLMLCSWNSLAVERRDTLPIDDNTFIRIASCKH